MTLRARLTAAFVVVLLVPLLVAGVLVGVVLPQASGSSQERDLTSSARLAASTVADACGRAAAAAEAAARAAAYLDGAALDGVVQNLVARRLVDGVRVVDGAGETRASAGTAPPVPETDCTTGSPTSADGTASIAATSTLRRGETVAGSVVASVTAGQTFAEQLRATAGQGHVALLVGDEVVAASDDDLDEDVLRAAVRAGGEPVVVDDQVAVLAEARGQQPVGLLLVQDSRRGWSPVWLVLCIAGGVLVLVLATVIATGLARATTGPLEELGRAAARIAGGDLSTSIEVRSRDEVGRLAAAFNAMTDKLRSYVHDLQDSRDQLQAGVARLGEALSGTHDLQRILTVVLDTAKDSTRSRAGAVLLLEPDSRQLVLTVGRNLAERGVREDLRVPVDAGIVGRVARSGLPARGTSGPGRDELRPAPGEPVGVPLVAVPLKSSTHDIGVLLLWDPAGAEGYTDHDLATLRTFTSQATVAVDNVLLHDEARRLSLTDGLTGLWNYRYFTMTVGKEIERAARFGRPLSLLLLDLDHFKLVNDVFGHPRGDAVLLELAARIRGQVRDVDVLARYGGEEFVAVLPETDQDGASHAAERIRAAVRRRPFGEDGEHPIDVTLSIGVAVYPDHGTTSTTLLRRADEALYAAKRGGRDTWRVAVPDPSPGPSADPMPGASPDPAAEGAARPS